MTRSSSLSWAGVVLLGAACLAPPGRAAATYPAHPRSWMNAAAIARVKGFLASDPVAQSYMASLVGNGEAILPQPPLPRPAPGPSGILVEVREVLDRIYTLGLLYQLTGNATWAERGIAEMLSAANYSDWNPPHFLDTGEMTHAMGVGYDAFFDALTDPQRATITQAIHAKGIVPYLQGVASNAWWWQTPWNWNFVCNGGVLAGALALGDDVPALSADVQAAVAHALEGLPFVASTYAPSGAWPEGVSYEDYATQYFMVAVAALDAAFAGNNSGLASSLGANDTCLFSIYETSSSTRAFNWADSSESPTPHIQLFWLANQYQVPACGYFARLDAAVFAPNRTFGLGGTLATQLLTYTPLGSAADLVALPTDRVYDNRFLALFRSDWSYGSVPGHASGPDADLRAAVEKQRAHLHVPRWLRGQTPLATAQSTFLAVKGGNNAWNHGHLDSGTFVYDYAEGRFASDLGSDNYGLPGYFGPQRFSYYRLNSLGHNVLLFDGGNQSFTSVSPVVDFASNANLSSGTASWAIVNTTAAYAGIAAGVQSVLRGAALVFGKQQLVIRDEIRWSDGDEGGGNDGRDGRDGHSAARVSELGTPVGNLTWRMHSQSVVFVESPTALRIDTETPQKTVVTTYLQLLVNSTACPGATLSTHNLTLPPPMDPVYDIVVVDITTLNPAACTAIAVTLGPLPYVGPDLFAVNDLANWSSAGPIANTGVVWD